MAQVSANSNNADHAIVIVMARLAIHVGMVLTSMRRYVECGDTSYDVLSHAGSPCIAAFWKY
jgi:hypothetical protein